MLNGDREHKRTASAILSHLSGRVGVTLHKWNKAGRGKSAVKHRCAGRTDMGEVVSHAAATLHKLHLLLIHLHNSAIGICRTVVSYNKAVGERGNLIIIAYSGHWASLRNNIFKPIQESKYLLLAHRVRIFLLNLRKLVGKTPMHINRGLLIQVAV